jgi:lipopolysaccharide transport protein LptA
MMRLKKAILCFAGLILFGAGIVGAMEVQGKKKEAAEPDRPIYVEADTLETDLKNNISTLTNNVMVRQEQKGKGPLKIYCQKMVIYSSDETRKKSSSNKIKGNDKKDDFIQQGNIDKIVATGQVRIEMGNNVATGETAVFYNDDQKIILTGKAEFWQGKSMIKGEEITYWIKEDRFLGTGKGTNKVKGVIYQEEKEESRQIKSGITPKGREGTGK